MRRKYGLFLVEGRKSVADLVRYCAGRFGIEYLVAAPEGEDSALCLAGELADLGISAPEIFSCSPSEMRDISSLTTAPGLIAVCALPARRSQEEILARPLPDDLYIMLDGVQDPGNLGTIVRTAHWMGVRRIFASPDTTDLFNPKTVQSSMGSLAAVEVEYVDLPALAAANPGIPVAGLLLEGENIYNVDLPSSAFIVMGNEGNGLSDAMRAAVDIALTIPPYDSADHSESLNVAVATAITLSQFRQNELRNMTR